MSHNGRRKPTLGYQGTTATGATGGGSTTEWYPRDLVEELYRIGWQTLTVTHRGRTVGRIHTENGQRRLTMEGNPDGK